MVYLKRNGTWVGGEHGAEGGSSQLPGLLSSSHQFGKHSKAEPALLRRLLPSSSSAAAAAAAALQCRTTNCNKSV